MKLLIKQNIEDIICALANAPRAHCKQQTNKRSFISRKQNARHSSIYIWKSVWWYELLYFAAIYKKRHCAINFSRKMSEATFLDFYEQRESKLDSWIDFDERNVILRMRVYRMTAFSNFSNGSIIIHKLFSERRHFLTRFFLSNQTKL